MKSFVIHFIASARSNFMKIAPIVRAMKNTGVDKVIIDTGQHYDKNMFEVFFRELGIPKFDYNLEVGSEYHAEQTAKVMIGFEKGQLKKKPNLVLVVEDVNFTIGCSLTVKKLRIRVAHLEAELMSFALEKP